jgi:hypothetical protein
MTHATGIPAGVGGSPPTTFQVEGGMINVGSPTDPIQFFILPDGDPWQKNFTIPIEPGLGLVPGHVIPVWEHLQIFPPPPSDPTIPIRPFTDWHEVIHNPDWEWAHPMTDPITGDVVPELVIHNLPGGPLHVPGMVGGPDGTSGPLTDTWFVWDYRLAVIPPINGLDVWIHKNLVYRGDPITNPTDQTQFVTVHVWEWPTVPEPSTFVLAGMGIIGLVGMAWRRRRSA